MPPLEARIEELVAEIEKVRAEYAAFRAEAEALQARLEKRIAELIAELENVKTVLEEKDEYGHTLQFRVDAAEAREKIAAKKLLILNSQYTKMVATFSAEDLMSTPAANPA